MQIINLTPHKITILGDRKLVLEPSGIIPRAEQHREQVGSVDGIPINRVSYGSPVGLPEPKAGTIYIVSALTAKAAKGRKDLYIVDDSVRDESGRIIGCRALARV
jgi:hypothetical protein